MARRGHIHGDPKPIQSAEGQDYIRKEYARRMGILNGYPTIRGYVHNDNWAAKYLADTLAKDGDVLELGYPDLYITPDFERTHIRPEGYMAKAESGLRFLIEKAPKQNRNDLIGNLQKGYSTAAAFEVVLAHALVTTFGEAAVEPYPAIAQGSKKNVEFGVDTNGVRVYFEATVLLDDQSEAASKAFCIRERTPFPIMPLKGDEGGRRLLRKCQGKAMQREQNCPLVLCVNQSSTLPKPGIAPQIMDELAAWADYEEGCLLVVAAYWFCDRLTVGHTTGQTRARRLVERGQAQTLRESANVLFGQPASVSGVRTPCSPPASIPGRKSP